MIESVPCLCMPSHSCDMSLLTSGRETQSLLRESLEGICGEDFLPNAHVLCRRMGLAKDLCQ